jgi:hypothetical protein
MSDTDETAAQPETLVIDIDPPITFKGGSYAALPLREPRAGEVRKAEGFMRNGIHAESMRLYTINLVSTVSNWPILAVEQLPISKLNEAAAFLAGFTEGGLRTGRS